MDVVLADPINYFDNEKICYQQIWKSYWYAHYGNLTLVTHKPTGYSNVTLLCKQFKKQFCHWHSNKNTKSLIEDLAAMMARGGSPVNAAQMLFTINGGSGEYVKIVSGTYVHPIVLSHI